MTETSVETQMPTSGNKMNLIAIVGIILVIGLVIYVMAQSYGTPPTGEINENSTGIMEEEVTMEDEGITEEEAMVKEFDVKAGGFYFEPNVMRVKLGDTVRIILNAADMTHDFVIDELGVRSSVIAGGDSTSVEFIADQLGEFEYYCGVSNHRQLGMTGTLIIEE